MWLAHRLQTEQLIGDLLFSGENHSLSCPPFPISGFHEPVPDMDNGMAQPQGFGRKRMCHLLGNFSDAQPRKSGFPLGEEPEGFLEFADCSAKLVLRKTPRWKGFQKRSIIDEPKPNCSKASEVVTSSGIERVERRPNLSNPTRSLSGSEPIGLNREPNPSWGLRKGSATR